MRDKVREGYEAGDYEGEFRNDRNVREEEKKLFTKLFKKIPDEGDILDLGCGTGEPFDRFMVEKGYNVKGVDLVEKHVHAAREIVPDAEFVQGDFFDVDPNEEKYDAVTSFYAVFHLPRKKHQKLFKHMNSLLRDEGMLLITVGGGEMDKYVNENWNGSEMVWSSYSQEKSKELLRESGFEIKETYEEKSEEEHHLWILAEKK